MEPSSRPDPSSAERVMRAPRSRAWRWVLGVFLPAILLLTGLVSYLRNQMGQGEATHAFMNARQVAEALVRFKSTYQDFPSEGTIPRLLNYWPEAEPVLGRRSSNDFLRQLIVASAIDREAPFGVAAQGVVHVPDECMVPGRLLEHGECGFAYVVWEKDPQEPKAPILMTPVIPGELKFDPRWAGAVVIVCCDGSVKRQKLDSQDRLMIDGKDFFDWSQPHWGGQRPKIAWPE